MQKLRSSPFRLLREPYPLCVVCGLCTTGYKRELSVPLYALPNRNRISSNFIDMVMRCITIYIYVIYTADLKSLALGSFTIVTI